MTEIWFFSHKNLGCCLIGHLHICLLSPVHRLSSFIILSLFVSLCLSVFLWPCLSVFVRISSSLVHLISYQFIGFFLRRTSLSGIEWMGLDWSTLHCIGHRFSKSTFGANKIFNINGLPGVWKWLNGYQLQVSGCRKSVQWGDRQQSEPSCWEILPLQILQKKLDE